MREQVCVYMCPWPRIQAALTDEWALNVTYKYDRGEQRTSLKKANELRALGRAGRRLRRLQPVRRGVPDRHRHPRRLAARLHPVRPVHRRLRQRDDEDRPGNPADRLRQRHQHPSPAGGQAAESIASSGRAPWSTPRMIAAVGAIMLYAMLTRTLLDINVLHDRNPGRGAAERRLGPQRLYRAAPEQARLRPRHRDRRRRPGQRHRPCRRRRFGHARPADDHPRPRSDHRAAGAGHRSLREQPREIDAGASSTSPISGSAMSPRRTDNFVAP